MPAVPVLASHTLRRGGVEVNRASRAIDKDDAPISDLLSRYLGSDHSWYSQFAGDHRCVCGPTTLVGDERANSVERNDELRRGKSRHEDLVQCDRGEVAEVC